MMKWAAGFAALIFVSGCDNPLSPPPKREALSQQQRPSCPRRNHWTDERASSPEAFKRVAFDGDGVAWFEGEDRALPELREALRQQGARRSNISLVVHPEAPCRGVEEVRSLIEEAFGCQQSRCNEGGYSDEHWAVP